MYVTKIEDNQRGNQFTSEETNVRRREQLEGWGPVVSANHRKQIGYEHPLRQNWSTDDLP
jgi:hypothetical protein